jgi:hypothetical protein
VNCGPRSILLYSYYRLLFTSIIYFLENNYLLPYDTFNPLFTANRWDWQPHCKLGQSTLVVMCAGSMLLLVQSYVLDKTPYINCLEQSSSQLASTFGSWFFLLLVQLNLGCILRETCHCAHHTFLSRFPTGQLAPLSMRHSTYILSRTLLIFAFTLTINHFKMLMLGTMWARNQWISFLKHKLKMSIWKLDITLLMFNLCLLSVSLKCPPLHSVSRRILYDHYRMY